MALETALGSNSWSRDSCALTVECVMRYLGLLRCQGSRARAILGGFVFILANMFIRIFSSPNDFFRGFLYASI